MTGDPSVDGVPVVHARRDGATTVNLMFRVGQADESLAQRGTTHLLEHLALFPLGIRDHHSNGQTGLHVTNFHATGSPAEVTSFLASLCEAISDPPMDRIPQERGVLRTEAAHRAGWSFGELAIWRHGTRNEGAAGYPEWGLEAVTADEVAAWRDRYFTADNCVLVVVGPSVPDDLRLRLPAGVRRPVPGIEQVAPHAAAAFSAGTGRMMFEAIVERSTPATVLTQVIDKLLYQDLRLDAAYSYTAGCGYEPRDADRAVLSGYADTLDEQVDPAVGAFLDVLARVRGGHVPDAMVADIVRSRLQAMSDPDFDVARTAASGFDRLVGARTPTSQQLEDELRALTTDDVRRTAASVFADVLVQLPAGHLADWAGFRQLSDHSETRVQADTIHRPRDEGAPLHLASDGISLVADGDQLTVLFATCAACLAWPDGRRHLIGPDGLGLSIEPNLYHDGEAVIRAIDARVPAGVVLPQPARAPEDIPPQPVVATAPARRRLFRRRE